MTKALQLFGQTLDRTIATLGPLADSKNLSVAGAAAISFGQELAEMFFKGKQKADSVQIQKIYSEARTLMGDFKDIIPERLIYESMEGHPGKTFAPSVLLGSSFDDKSSGSTISKEFKAYKTEADAAHSMLTRYMNEQKAPSDNNAVVLMFLNICLLKLKTVPTNIQEREALIKFLTKFLESMSDQTFNESLARRKSLYSNLIKSLNTLSTYLVIYESNKAIATKLQELHGKFFEYSRDLGKLILANFEPENRDFIYSANEQDIASKLQIARVAFSGKGGEAKYLKSSKAPLLQKIISAFKILANCDNHETPISLKAFEPVCFIDMKGLSGLEEKEKEKFKIQKMREIVRLNKELFSCVFFKKLILQTGDMITAKIEDFSDEEVLEKFHLLQSFEQLINHMLYSAFHARTIDSARVQLVNHGNVYVYSADNRAKIIAILQKSNKDLSDLSLGKNKFLQHLQQIATELPTGSEVILTLGFSSNKDHKEIPFFSKKSKELITQAETISKMTSELETTVSSHHAIRVKIDLADKQFEATLKIAQSGLPKPDELDSFKANDPLLGDLASETKIQYGVQLDDGKPTFPTSSNSSSSGSSSSSTHLSFAAQFLPEGTSSLPSTPPSVGVTDLSSLPNTPASALSSSSPSNTFSPPGSLADTPSSEIKSDADELEIVLEQNVNLQVKVATLGRDNREYKELVSNSEDLNLLALKTILEKKKEELAFSRSTEQMLAQQILALEDKISVNASRSRTIQGLINKVGNHQNSWKGILAKLGLSSLTGGGIAAAALFGFIAVSAWPIGLGVGIGLLGWSAWTIWQNKRESNEWAEQLSIMQRDQPNLQQDTLAFTSDFSNLQDQIKKTKTLKEELEQGVETAQINYDNAFLEYQKSHPQLQQDEHKLGSQASGESKRLQPPMSSAQPAFFGNRLLGKGQSTKKIIISGYEALIKAANAYYEINQNAFQRKFEPLIKFLNLHGFSVQPSGTPWDSKAIAEGFTNKLKEANFKRISEEFKQFVNIALDTYKAIQNDRSVFSFSSDALTQLEKFLTSDDLLGAFQGFLGKNVTGIKLENEGIRILSGVEPVIIPRDASISSLAF